MSAVDLFDTDAKRVLALAQTEALALHHPSLEPEHLLTALAREGWSAASRLLQSSGLDLATARRVVAGILRPGAPAGGDMVVSAASKRIFALAAEEAKQSGSPKVRADHLLLAIAGQPGRAASVLIDFGLSLDVVRQRLQSGTG